MHDADDSEHDAELQAFLHAGIDAMGDARTEPGYGAIVIARAPCGCVGYLTGGLEQLELIQLLMETVKATVEETGGTCHTLLRDGNYHPGLSSNSTAPGPAA